MPSNEVLFNIIYVFIFPVVMMIMGIKYKVKTPDFPKKNDVSKGGYRSAMAKSSKDAWKMAHDCIGILWTVFGAVMLVVTAFCMNWMLNYENIDLAAVILVFIQIVVVVVPPVVITEIRLRKVFDKDGNRKE